MYKGFGTDDMILHQRFSPLLPLRSSRRGARRAANRGWGGWTNWGRGIETEMGMMAWMWMARVRRVMLRVMPILLTRHVTLAAALMLDWRLRRRANANSFVLHWN